MTTKNSIIVFMFVVIWKKFYFHIKKKECIVWNLLLTILFSDFVSFGFSTTDIVI